MKKPTTLSYATWNPSNIKDLSFPKNLVLKNTSWVIVGLNPSKRISFPENFHMGKFDKWHSLAFIHNEIEGASMLGLIDEVDLNSKNIIKKWKVNNNWRKKQIARFIAEIEFLFKKDKPNLLCIGKNASELILKGKGIIRLFSRMHVVSNPNGVRVKGAQQEYVKMVNKCADN
ncbi:hypothetical protein AUK15_02925 [Candidatus Nomurabacteria bacterium CG2_30_43_9]|uniref:Uracil-DNA glycosylase-like domain-containing protein n=1 Tax=Candidatus Nomurabacteria bacterium CG2_30_43_9 TaxID=1805283 RepID=A0A1J5GCB7_9BACT|nr:MAG: hypothetical protein AUK15_02925 [Candidatus Nomurabacteria bacterium CG2_30_43_9]